MRRRFGSYTFGAGLSGLLLALAPSGHLIAWFLLAAAVVLGVLGFARYAQRAVGDVLVRTVNASRNRCSATSGSPDAHPSSPTTPA